MSSSRHTASLKMVIKGTVKASIDNDNDNEEEGEGEGDDILRDRTG